MIIMSEHIENESRAIILERIEGRGRPNMRRIDSIKGAIDIWFHKSWAGLLKTGHCRHHCIIGSPGVGSDTKEHNIHKWRKESIKKISQKF